MDAETLVPIAISLIWLLCLVVCFLKAKYGMAVVGLVAAVAQEVGLPPIGGYYILNLIYPLSLLPFFGAIRLAHPDSLWARWFYGRNIYKFWRAIERSGEIEEYAHAIAEHPEIAEEFELFLKRRLTPEQRLSGLKTTEAAELSKLTRLGMDAYMAEKTAEIGPKIDAYVAELREQQKDKEKNTK